MAFTQATAKKTKKQREEEAAEVKRRQHELETSQVFEEYVADFATAPRAKGTMSFVKAGESALSGKMRTAAAFGDDHRMVSALCFYSAWRPIFSFRNPTLLLLHKSQRGSEQWMRSWRRSNGTMAFATMYTH